MPDSRGVRPTPGPVDLRRYAWLSIGAAVVTAALKTVAWRATGSVGLLSDALESLVNLVAAGFTLAMLTWAARPPDPEHAYGHGKAEYFASAAEGAMILVAALAIGWAAVDRLVAPRPLAHAGAGIAVSVAASAVNLATARILLAAGRRHRSIALEADARHLLTDVWTTAGVVAGVGAVAATGWERLDPLVALAVAVHIVWSGGRLVHRSALGLLDTALPPQDQAALEAVLARHAGPETRFHAIRTRQAGRRRFVSMHVLVPGAWTVARGHRLLEELEESIRAALPGVSVFTHLEPLEDPASFADEALDRPARGEADR
jgi:cation diffusion facilitator family transporter